MSDAWAVILAAGEGKRMKSHLPKVLHKICGLTLLEHVLRNSAAVAEKQIVVLGHYGDMIKKYMGDNYLYAVQEEQLGTGDAVRSAMHLLPDSGEVIVLCGDTPLLTTEELQQLVTEHRRQKASVTVLTFVAPQPGSYGRVVRDETGGVQRIVEASDAGEKELLISEINSGTYCFDISALRNVLPLLTTTNAQGEFYLTDAVAELKARGGTIAASTVTDYRNALGVNSRIDLAAAAAIMRKRINMQLMSNGVTMIDPDSVYADISVKIKADTILYPQTVLEGETVIGSNCIIGPGCRLSDTVVGEECHLRDVTALEAVIGDHANVGPYAYLRPGTVLEEGVKIGDFVEVKKSYIGKGSKISHLAYIGDARLGSGVNMGCGTIVVNYNGKNKQETIINSGAFIGCNSNLIAPVEIGEKAYIGAGSTITEDVPPGALSLERGKQVIKPGLASRFLLSNDKQEKPSSEENK